METNIVWLKIEGISQTELLDGMGIKITVDGLLIYHDKIAKDVDGNTFTIDKLKAIVPSDEGLGFITDLMQLESE